MSARVRVVVLPVAGLGTRFLPVTKAVPKEMLPLVDRPILAYIAAEAVAAGIERIVLVTARGKGAIEDYFDRSPELERHLEQVGKTDLLYAVREAATMATVVTIRQPESRGLGHAVLAARPLVPPGEPFAVMLGDEVMVGPDPALGRVLAEHQAHGRSVVGLVEVPPDQTHRYGICVGAPYPGEGRDPAALALTQMVEKPPPGTAPSALAIVGRYVCTPDLWDELAALGPGAGGEIQLTDGLARQAARGGVTGLLLPHRRFDTGNPLGLLEAAMHLAHARPDLRDGVREICRQILSTPMDEP